MADKKFIYKRRYGFSVRTNYEKRIESIKKDLLFRISKLKFLSKKIDGSDRYYLNSKDWKHKYRFREKLDLGGDPNKDYKGIRLKNINFFEVIEIDDFDKYRKTITSKFGKDELPFNIGQNKDLKDSLSQVKDSFDSVSWGRLCYLDYSKRKGDDSDLISSINISFIKTNESYFIFRIEVTPSVKFEKLFSEIIEEEDVDFAIRRFNSFLDILKTGRFISGESMISSLRFFNIDNLVADVDAQIKLNVTKHLKGFFHKSSKHSELPRLELFEVGSIEAFRNDDELSFGFRTGAEGKYRVNNDGIEICWDKSYRSENTRIQIVKQKGHGAKAKRDNDLTDYDWLESKNLVSSLTFPFVFNSILIMQFDRLNKLKRSVYDFVNRKNRSRLYRILQYVRLRNRYTNLKQDLSHILMVTKRFESEFTQENLNFYTEDFDLNRFSPEYYRKGESPKNLKQKIVEELTDQIEELNKRTKSVNQVFGPIEELYAYKTNLRLQVISLWIGIFAFIFAFDKVQKVFWDIVNYFTNW